jgi:hypothetical protein
MILLLILAVVLALLVGNAITTNDTAKITGERVIGANIKIEINNTGIEENSTEKTEKFI